MAGPYINFIHDHADTAYRDPVGALQGGSTVTLRLALKQGAASPLAVMLVLRPDGAGEWRTAMRQERVQGVYAVYAAELKLAAGLYFYYFTAEVGGECVRFFADGEDVLEEDGETVADANCWQITAFEAGFDTPHWLVGRIIYHIFIDRFRASGNVRPRPNFRLHKVWGGQPDYLPAADGEIHNDDVFGGDLRGIIEKLDYLVSLHVGAIYLSPVFRAESNHKYNTGDYLSIDGMFGSEADFDDLVRETRARDIYLILDGVFNHTGDDSIYFNKYGRYPGPGACQSKDSRYYDWYTFEHWRDGYECWWGVPTLPSIRKDSPDFREFVCGRGGVLEHWMARGVRGWRLDVADELSDGMLDAIRKTAKAHDPDTLVLGEVWEDASTKIAYGERRRYFQGAQLDSVMNYPLQDAIIAYLRGGDCAGLALLLAREQNNYPASVQRSLMNILGTHDTMRVLSALGADEYPDGGDREAQSKAALTPEQRSRGLRLLRAAALLQMTLPGVPCVFYGDEAGVEGWGDPFCRACYPWGSEDAGLLGWYRKLGEIRASREEFREGEYKLLRADRGLFCFSRGGKVVVAVNLNEEAYRFDGAMYSLIDGKRAAQVDAGGWGVYLAD